MLKVLTLKDSCEWDKIVKSFNNYDVYYLSGYAKGFYIHGDGEPLLFYYEDADVKAINVVMKRDISNDERFYFLEKNKYFDFTTPYGYGGWIIEGNENINNIFSEYRNWCINNSIISEVIRFHPVLNNQEQVKGIYNVLEIGNTISIDLISEEEIWNNFSSKNRNKIRKAIKNNLIVKHGLSSELFDVFKEIYNKTMDRDDANSYYYFKKEFYDSILNDLNSESDIFYVEYDNKIIAATIIIKSNSKLNYHLSGSLKEYKCFAPTNLLLSEISKWGYKEGYKTFHLGGGVGAKMDSLYEFKKGFNRNEDRKYYIGRLIFDEDKYKELVSFRKNEEMRDNFFPLYRA